MPDTVIIRDTSVNSVTVHEVVPEVVQVAAVGPQGPATGQNVISMFQTTADLVEPLDAVELTQLGVAIVNPGTWVLDFHILLENIDETAVGDDLLTFSVVENDLVFDNGSLTLVPGILFEVNRNLRDDRTMSIALSHLDQRNVCLHLKAVVTNASGTFLLKMTNGDTSGRLRLNVSRTSFVRAEKLG